MKGNFYQVYVPYVLQIFFVLSRILIIQGI